MKNIWANLPKQIGWIGQWLGMLVVIGGIYFEYRTDAHIGWIILSIGSLIYAVSTKIVHRRK